MAELITTETRIKVSKCRYCTTNDMLKKSWCNLQCEIKEMVRIINKNQKLTEQEKQIPLSSIDDFLDKKRVTLNEL